MKDKFFTQLMGFKSHLEEGIQLQLNFHQITSLPIKETRVIIYIEIMEMSLSGIELIL